MKGGSESGQVVMPTRLFRDDEGSTSFSVMVAVVLVIAIMALSAQLYWVQSSSASIQTVADAGALAGASMISKVIIIVQVLDGILLTMNIVGLVMHFVVVVAGIAAVFAPPAAEVFEQVRSVDKAYMNVRLRVADAFIQAAEALDKIAPYLAAANSAAVVSENSNVASAGSTYVGMAIPVPFRGDLSSGGARATMTPPTGEAETLGDETQANRKAARAAKVAEEEMDRALKEGFEADAYKAVPFKAWNFEIGKEDFQRELASVFSAVRQAEPGFNAVDYRGTADEMNEYLHTQVGNWSSQCEFEQFQSTRYFCRDKTGERYHTQGCRYLNAENSPSGDVASDAAAVVLRDCRAQGLLPCGDSQDAPLDWRALSEWDDRLGDFRKRWSDEVYWHARYVEAEARHAKAVEQQKTELEGVDDAFEDAKAKLLGRRLTYEPCGSKGFICVVAQTNTRRIPSFTLPALTGSTAVQTGPQVAMAAAKVLPAKGVSTISSIMDGIAAKARTGETQAEAGPLAFVRPMAGGTDLVFELWDAALSFYTDGIVGLRGFVDRLFSSGWIPGAEKIRGWAQDSIDEVLLALNIAPPELRQPQPVLVNTRFVLDDVPGGTAIVKAKDAYFRSGGATASGLKLVVKDWVRDAKPEEMGDLASGVDVPLNVRFTVLGKPLAVEYVLKLPIPAPVVAKLRGLASRFDELIERMAVP